MLYIWRSDDIPQLKSVLLLPFCCDVISGDDISDSVGEYNNVKVSSQSRKFECNVFSIIHLNGHNV